MKIEKLASGRAVILAVHGKYTGEGGPTDLHATVRDLIRQGCRQIVLDCSDLQWINSNGIGEIIGSCHSLRREGGCLKICNLNDRSRRVFDVCGLDRVLDIRGTREEALAAFARDRKAQAEN